MKKKCKVVALPTKDTVRLAKRTIPGGSYFYLFDEPYQSDNSSYSNHHLYIVSDDEIKEGDYVYCKSDVLDDFVAKVETSEELAIARGEQYVCKSKKVIATTKPSLNLPLIPDCFCWEYCRENGINEVMVEILDDIASVSLVKQSWNREEVEALCREAFSSGWDSCLDDNDIIPDYKGKEDEFINNNL